MNQEIEIWNVDTLQHYIFLISQKSSTLDLER